MRHFLKYKSAIELKDENIELNLDFILQNFLVNYKWLKNHINITEHADFSKEILFITRFPPIVGGVATQEYWRARYLAGKGFKVRVITNTGEADREYLAQNFTCEDFSWLNFRDSRSGGLLQTYFTEISVINGKARKHHEHIPMDKMSHSKLVGLALKIIEQFNCSMIFSGYLEPYGAAAREVSSITGIPVNQYFAGSDIERLTRIPEIGWRIKDVLCNANMISTTWDRFSQLIAMNVSLDIMSPIPAPTLLPGELFNSEGKRIYRKTSSEDLVIGIYGKYNRSKCIEEVISSINIMINKGYKVKLLLMLGGEVDNELLKLINELSSYIKLINLVPPWKVPEFIRSCDAICLLEEGFSIKSHAPITPYEVAMCGVCVIFSKEMFEKIRLQGFEENVNCVIIDNPRISETIANKLEELIIEKKAKIYGHNAIEAGHKILSASSIHTFLKTIKIIQSNKVKHKNKESCSTQEIIIMILSFYPLTMSFLKKEGMSFLINWIKQKSFIEIDYFEIIIAFSKYIKTELLGINIILDELITFENARIESISLVKNMSSNDFIYDYFRIETFIHSNKKLVPNLRYIPVIVELSSNVHQSYNYIYDQKVNITFNGKKTILVITSHDFKPFSFQISNSLANLIFENNFDISLLYSKLQNNEEFNRLLNMLEQNNIVYWRTQLKNL